MNRALLLVVAVACSGKSDPPPPVPDPKPRITAALPEVDPVGFESYDDDRVDLVVTPEAITLDGNKLVEVRDGDVPPDAKEGGAIGMRIDPLTTALAARHAKEPGDEWLVLAIDPRVPYKLLIEVMFSAKQKEAGYKRFRVLGRAGERIVHAPITLPDRRPPPLVAEAKPPPGGIVLKLVASVTKTELVVWSISGLEGTLGYPKYAFARSSKTAVEDVRTTLTAMVKRHWPRGGAERDREIVVMAMAETPMQLVAELFGAVRAARDGTALFTDIVLSTGFE